MTLRREPRTVGKARVWLIGLLVILGSCSALGVLTAKETCPYRSIDPTSGTRLVICYTKDLPWLPIMWEGYLVYADLYDSRDVRLSRRLVENVDIPIDVEHRYSKIRWDAAMGAFVDNEELEIARPPAR